MGYIDEFDRQAAAAVKVLPVSWQPLMRGLTALGEPAVVVGAGLAGLVAASLRGQTAAEKAFVGAMLGYGAGILLKHLVHRARPGHLKVESFGLRSYSFPSGHAFGTVIFYGLFAVIDARHLLFPWDLLSSIIIWSVIFMVGVSRVYLKSHFPSDVVGGWLFGGLVLAIVVRVVFK